MAIPPGSLQTSFDFQDTACFVNGGTAITDLSGNSNNWTINNTTYTFDNTVGSILFPTGCYADGTPSTYAFGTAAFSILAWVKFNTYNSGINICNLGGSSSTGHRTYFYWRSSDNFIVSDNLGAAGAWLQTADNEWHLLALTRPSSAICGNQQAYIDGVLITNNPANFYNPSTNLNQGSGVAKIHDTAGAPGDLEIGSFDVYTTQVSAGDILDIYNNTKNRFDPSPPPPPVYAGNVGGRQFAQGFNG
jgi:hypothetical protein